MTRMMHATLPVERDDMEDKSRTSDETPKQPYVEMTLQKRQRLVEITEGVVTSGVTA